MNRDLTTPVRRSPRLAAETASSGEKENQFDDDNQTPSRARRLAPKRFASFSNTTATAVQNSTPRHSRSFTRQTPATHKSVHKTFLGEPAQRVPTRTPQRKSRFLPTPRRPRATASTNSATHTPSSNTKSHQKHTHHLTTPARRVVRKPKTAPQTVAAIRSADELRRLHCDFAVRPVDGNVPRSATKQYTVYCFLFHTRFLKKIR